MDHRSQLSMDSLFRRRPADSRAASRSASLSRRTAARRRRLVIGTQPERQSSAWNQKRVAGRHPVLPFGFRLNAKTHHFRPTKSSLVERLVSPFHGEPIQPQRLFHTPL
jgi:hypothetical protein